MSQGFPSVFPPCSMCVHIINLYIYIYIYTITHMDVVPQDHAFEENPGMNGSWYVPRGDPRL